MNDQEFSDLVDRLDTGDTTIHHADVGEAELADLSPEQAGELVERFGASTLITLPRREREFFEWLRENDPAVWSDLWGGDEIPYRVSLAYLPDLLPKGRGFLICDLTEQPNYYFTRDSITAEEGSALLDAALNIVRAEGQLQMHQAFLIEAWRAPIDMWRFTWMYRQRLEDVKQMVAWLLDEGILRLPQEEEEETSADGEEPTA